MEFSEVSEWWDGLGHHHEGAPSDDELLDEAVQLTLHAWDTEGNDVYWTSFSDDGWEPDELAEDIEDGRSHYVQGGQ